MSPYLLLDIAHDNAHTNTVSSQKRGDALVTHGGNTATPAVLSRAHNHGRGTFVALIQRAALIVNMPFKREPLALVTGQLRNATAHARCVFMVARVDPTFAGMAFSIQP